MDIEVKCFQGRRWDVRFYSINQVLSGDRSLSDVNREAYYNEWLTCDRRVQGRKYDCKWYSLWAEGEYPSRGELGGDTFSGSAGPDLSRPHLVPSLQVNVKQLTACGQACRFQDAPRDTKSRVYSVHVERFQETELRAQVSHGWLRYTMHGST